MASILAISLATLALAWASSRLEGSAVAPGALFALMWSGYLLSAALFVTDVEHILMGLVWIWLSVGSLLVGAILCGPFLRRARPRTPRVGERGRRWLRGLALGAVLVGLADIYMTFRERGVGLGEMFTFVAITQVSSINRSEFYAGTAETSVAQRVAFSVMFIGTIYGGLLFRLARHHGDRVVGILTLLVIALLYALYGSRMGVLYGGSLWLASYLAAHVAMSDPTRGVEVRFLARLGAAAVVILLGLSTLTQVIRYTASQKDLDWFKMVADPFAFVAAFGIWFDRTGLAHGDLLYGARIFRRLFELAGVHAELAPAIEVGFTSSNIYTVFRDLLEDFGAAGSLCFTMMLGFTGRFAFSRTIDGSLAALPWLMVVYAFTNTSFSSGLLSYTTPTVAIVGFLLTFGLMPPIIEGTPADATQRAPTDAPAEAAAGATP